MLQIHVRVQCNLVPIYVHLKWVKDKLIKVDSLISGGGSQIR